MSLFLLNGDPRKVKAFVMFCMCEVYCCYRTGPAGSWTLQLFLDSCISLGDLVSDVFYADISLDFSAWARPHVAIYGEDRTPKGHLFRQSQTSKNHQMLKPSISALIVLLHIFSQLLCRISLVGSSEFGSSSCTIGL